MGPGNRGNPEQESPRLRTQMNSPLILSLR